MTGIKKPQESLQLTGRFFQEVSPLTFEKISMEHIIKPKSNIANNALKYTSIPGVYLGSLPIHEPVPNDGASRASKKNTLISPDGVIECPPDSSENRVNRYIRQSASRRLLHDKRVLKCLRWKIAKTVKVHKSKEHNKCHFSDLVICGSVWDCPVCAAKISERRRIELSRAVTQYTSQGGSVLLVTFTYPHKKEDDLKELLSKQAKAMEWFYRHRVYRELKKRYQKEGRVKALEVNHGDLNGWHPHVHELWFIDLHLSDYETLKFEVFSLWVKACKKYGLGQPSWEHGVDVRGGEDASGYIAKYGLEDTKDNNWGIEHELTKANAKKGRNGSRSPFQLLDGYIEGDKQSGALFIEYSKAFYRKRQLVWSRGLKSIFDLEELTDEELAVKQDDEAVLLGEISSDEWKAIINTSSRQHDNRALVLTLAENGGADAMFRFIRGLVAAYRKNH